MMRALLCAIALCLAITGNLRGEERAHFTVTYVSAEHVYIDGGAEDGLRVGYRLSLESNGGKPALEIVYVSGHSASCRPLPDAPAFAVGTNLRLLATSAITDEPAAAEALRLTVTSPPPPLPLPAVSGPAPLPVRLSGTVALGFYHFADAAPANLDFSQTNARLNLQAQHLWNAHTTLIIRTRGRYDSRQRSYSGLDRTDWENRLWELSISHDNPSAPFTFSAGRILPRQLSTAGYLDGALVEWRATALFRLGFLAGQQPDWLYRTENTSITRYGGYLSYGSRNLAISGFAQTIGLIVETQSGATNRNYLAAQGRITGRRWGFSHSAEIDINTDWREERAGNTLSLSRSYLQAYLQATRRLRLNLSYDNYRRYWTYEYRTLADSLFDDRTRQGVRARIDWSAASSWRLSLGGGLRDQPNDSDPTVTYSLSIRRASLFSPRFSASAHVSGFDGDRERGLTYAIQFNVMTRPIGLLHLRLGRYQYAVQTIATDRSTWSLETGLDTDLARRYYLSGLVQYNSGDDIDGWRLQTEFGYRF